MLDENKVKGNDNYDSINSNNVITLILIMMQIASLM